MSSQRIPFRRRQFLVKQGFQARFALYPLAFLAVFLAAAGAYLHAFLRDFLEFQLYAPHSHLDNPWHEISPVLFQVAGWGGGAFLAALALWVWWRFGVLHRDLDRLADWLAAHARDQGDAAVPPLADFEVRVLGEGLGKAVAELEAWDRRVADAAAAARAAVEAVPQAAAAERAAVARHLAEARGALERLDAVVGEVSVDEGLS